MTKVVLWQIGAFFSRFFFIFFDADWLQYQHKRLPPVKFLLIERSGRPIATMRSLSGQRWLSDTRYGNSARHTCIWWYSGDDLAAYPYTTPYPTYPYGTQPTTGGVLPVSASRSGSGGTVAAAPLAKNLDPVAAKAAQVQAALKALPPNPEDLAGRYSAAS